jgi:predicted kinase
LPVRDAEREQATERADRPAPDRGGPAGELGRRLEHLADGHPSGPGYTAGWPRADQVRSAAPGDARRAKSPDQVRPLTDAEHGLHVAEVRLRLSEARSAGLASDRQHTIDPRGEFWSGQRQLLHDQLVDELYGARLQAPCEHRAVLAGGLAGAGKSTVLSEHAGLDLSAYLMINPDALKEELASRGLVPAVGGLSPMEASQLVHEESSHIAKCLALRAQADGRNVIWDITMSSGDSTGDRIDRLRAGGYARIEGIFVDVPAEISARRADARHREGHEAFRSGHGLGGRYVPAEMILGQRDPEWGSRNRRVFEQVKDRFDAWSRYDNSVEGCAPVLIESCRRSSAEQNGDSR